MSKPRPLSALLCRACIAAAATVGPDIGRGIAPSPPGGASGELLHWPIITSTAAAGDGDDDGNCIRGMPAAADVSTGGLDMTERLISSVNILSYVTVYTLDILSYITVYTLVYMLDILSYVTVYTLDTLSYITVYTLDIRSYVTVYTLVYTLDILSHVKFTRSSRHFLKCQFTRSTFSPMSQFTRSSRHFLKLQFTRSTFSPTSQFTRSTFSPMSSVSTVSPTIRLTILTCAQKLTSSQLNLQHGTEQTRIMKKLKPKNGDAQKKWSGHEVRGVSPEAGRESMVGKICGRGRS